LNYTRIPYSQHGVTEAADSGIIPKLDRSLLLGHVKVEELGEEMIELLLLKTRIAREVAYLGYKYR
jgi:hypothetical protein